jgi:hypothetical protein
MHTLGMGHRLQKNRDSHQKNSHPISETHMVKMYLSAYNILEDIHNQIYNQTDEYVIAQVIDHVMDPLNDIIVMEVFT